jgi:hypothetical protein
MQYRSILFILFSLATFCTNAQLKQNAALTDLAKINLFNPGVSFEKRINSNQTLYLNTFYNPSLSLINNGFLSNTLKFEFEPSASIQYRFYYNIPVRADKMNMRNSYNYVCPTFETSFSKKYVLLFNSEELKRISIYKIGALWGIQRNYNNRFSLDCNLGVGYISYKTTSEVIPNAITVTQVGIIRPMGHLNFGFYLGKKKY